MIDHNITINDKQHEFFIPLEGQPSIVRFDPDYSILAKIDFAKTDEQLISQLANEKDMIGRILAVKGLAKKKNHKAN